MARFTAAEAVEFGTLRAVCYQGLPAMALLERVTERLLQVIGADAFCSNLLDPATGLLINAVSRGWPDAARPLLIEHVLLTSPAADPAGFLRSGRRVATVEELLADRDAPGRDPYYTYHLLPFGYQHEVQALCSVRGEPQAFVILTRKPAAEPFTVRHQRFLAALAPHIAAGVARARVQEVLAAPRGDEIGVLVADQSGQIELTNQVAERWLSADVRTYWPVGLPLLVRRLTGQDPDGDDRRFAGVELTHPGTGGRYCLHWERRLGADGAPRTVMLLEPVRATNRPALLRPLGLTPREVEATLGVLRGLEVKEIAAHLRCSPHTVSQHLKSVFLKLGVSSRGELAARLLGDANLTAES